jgi:DNA helicase HerA-like ATPase
MHASQQRGQLYLGREYDLPTGTVTDRPVLYDAHHLTTHAVILGMTGSGKTGLGVVLLEEALLQGVPALILDPKGDIANLLLTFPELRGEDFAPWVDLEGARQRGVGVEEFAADEARRRRDAELGKARARTETRMARVQASLRREERELAEDYEELEARKREELLTLGESAFNLLTGRRPSYMISWTSRRRTLTRKAKADVEESYEAIEDLEGQLGDLADQWQREATEINARWAATLEEIRQVAVTPRRSDVLVEFCGLAWVPFWRVVVEDGRQVDLPARDLGDQGS